MEPKFKVGDRVKLLIGAYSGDVKEIKEVRKHMLGTRYVIEIGGMNHYYGEENLELAEWGKPDYCYKVGYGDKVGVVFEQELELVNSTTEPTTSYCRSHHWVSYVGFSETFEYCKHCDTKR